ncbi:MAG TPA: hypothetical protein VEB21_06810 [Terriglobales bacterium]|nr:hypothetical protein [Terriglobales bacterium]
MEFPKVASLRSVAGLRGRLRELGLELPCDETILSAPASPLASELGLGDDLPAAANRFAIHPMEGWDGHDDGTPSELTRRRWENFGRSGAALIWGGEAAAVRADGRANPNQLMMIDATAAALGDLRRALLAAASAAALPRPVVGLQLTHSGRWARAATAESGNGAKGRPAPLVAYRHPVLDRRTGIDSDTAVLSDGDIDALIQAFARAAYLAQQEGFDFVDIKHCHGYLLHELLSARTRSGRWGGPTFGERHHLTRAIIAAVRQAAPGLAIGVRLSVFDTVPHRPSANDDGILGPGVPEDVPLPYRFGFGLDAEAPTRIDLREPIALIRELVGQKVRLINVTAGSPYYCPHIQRPAAFPPSDGYAPPEDPLAGVVRLLRAARAIKESAPEAIVVSTGWSYLQDYLPHVAQACVRAGWCDAVGLGRMVLSYPELPTDVLAGRGLARKRICRTFSDCTTAPRRGLISGCYPLDPHYRKLPERDELERRRKLS